MGKVSAKDTSSDTSVVGGLGSNVEVVGNRIQLSNIHSDGPLSPSPSFTQFGRGYRHDGILHIKHEELRSCVLLMVFLTFVDGCLTFVDGGFCGGFLLIVVLTFVDGGFDFC